MSSIVITHNVRGELMDAFGVPFAAFDVSVRGAWFAQETGFWLFRIACTVDTLEHHTADDAEIVLVHVLLAHRRAARIRTNKFIPIGVYNL